MLRLKIVIIIDILLFSYFHIKVLKAMFYFTARKSPNSTEQ